MEERSYFFGLQSPQKKDSHHIYIATFFSAKGTEYPEITIMANASEPVVARLMLPDDANLAGNVHGGTILQLLLCYPLPVEGVFEGPGQPMVLRCLGRQTRDTTKNPSW